MSQFNIILPKDVLMELPAMVADFVSRKVAVVAAMGGVNTALAAKPASTTIAGWFFANGSDPVQFGLVQSLDRQGGNMTGVSFFTARLEAKRLGLLLNLRRPPLSWDSGQPDERQCSAQLKDMAARSAGARTSQ